MTEKRFTIFGEWHKDCVIDEIRDNTGEYVTIGRVVDLLNENVQLKKDCTNLICHNQDYRKENEQLKSEKKDMQILINTISDQRNEFHRGARENANRVGKLEKENEQLKSELRNLRRLANELYMEGSE